MTITFGSLFAGIGGFDLGFEQAGMKCIWQVEKNEYAVKVLEKQWPHVHRWDDVRTFPPVPAGDWRADVICGGFPCQDLSPAGKGKGLSGDRSGLWYEMRRIVEAIIPRCVVIENTHHCWRRWVPFVRRDLRRIGYASVPFRLQASDFGLYHRRARAFVVAYNDSLGCDWGSMLQEAANATRRVSPEGGYAIAPDAHSAWQLQQEGGLKEQRRRSSDSAAQARQRWSIEPCLGRGLHGVSAKVDRIRCLGNAVVPQVARWIGLRIVENWPTSRHYGKPKSSFHENRVLFAKR